MVSTDPAILVVDAHELIASSLAVALRYAGFDRVETAGPDSLADDQEVAAPGDLVLLGLLYGDGRTALPLIRPLTDRGCRVLVMASDQGLPLAGECLGRGAETVLDEAMSFERLVAVLHRLRAGGQAMTEDERSALLEGVERLGAAERAVQPPVLALT